MKVSECCGAPNTMINDDLDYEDISRCPECKDNCVFVDEDEKLAEVVERLFGQ